MEEEHRETTRLLAAARSQLDEAAAAKLLADSVCDSLQARSDGDVADLAALRVQLDKAQAEVLSYAVQAAELTARVKRSTAEVPPPPPSPSRCLIVYTLLYPSTNEQSSIHSLTASTPP